MRGRGVWRDWTVCLCGVARRCCTHGLGHVKRRRVSGAARTPVAARTPQRVSERETHTCAPDHGPVYILPQNISHSTACSLHLRLYMRWPPQDSAHSTDETSDHRRDLASARCRWCVRCGAPAGCRSGVRIRRERADTTHPHRNRDVRHKATSSIGVPRSVTRRAPRLAVARAPGIMATLKLREEGGVSIGEVRRGLRCVAGGHASGMVRLA